MKTYLGCTYHFKNVGNSEILDTVSKFGYNCRELINRLLGREGLFRQEGANFFIW